MTQTYGPFASGAGASLGQDPYLDFLGPMLQGDGVNTNVIGGAALQVYGNSSGLQVLVRAGSALVRGVMYSNTADVTLAIGANATGSTRIDRVVLRMNRSANIISPVVIPGTPGSGEPALTQAVGGTWDLPLARVTVAPSASTVAPGDVADERQYLPLRINYCDTRYSTPPVDGSAGRIFYDLNPGVADVIVTNGTAWSPVTLRDSGWSNLSFANSFWTTPGYGPQVRKVGPLVEFRVDALGQFSTGSGPANRIVTLPVGYRPAVSRFFSVPVDSSGAGVPASIGPNVNVNPDGTVLAYGGRDTSGNFVGLLSVRFFVNVSFIAG